MSEQQTPRKKLYIENTKLKVYTVTAGEQRAKSSLGFSVFKGDFSFTATIRKDSDQKTDRGIYIAVGMDIFTAQMVIDAMKRAAQSDGAFDTFTVVTNGKTNWDPATKRATPGEIKNEITIFKKPNGVICIAFKDVAKDVKTAIELIHPNSQIYHNVLINKEPITDSHRSRLLVLAMCQQMTMAIALCSHETYEPMTFNDKDKPRGGGNYGGGYNTSGNGNDNGGNNTGYKPAPVAPAITSEDDIPY